MSKIFGLDGKPILKDKFRLPERYRVESPNQTRFNIDQDNGGFFMIPVRGRGDSIICAVATSDNSWDHVSLKLLVDGLFEMPTWDVMEFAKQLFWEPEACVVQYHPPCSEYVCNDKDVLHLWRFQGVSPRPDPILAGLHPGKEPLVFDPKIFKKKG